MKYIDAIYIRLKALGEERGMTFRQLCKNAGLSEATACKFESGNKNDINLSTFTKLLRALKISVNEFYDDDIFKPFEGGKLEI